GRMMAVYDLEEQEKIEDLKAWWNQYGKYVSAAVTAVAIVVIGVQGWRWYQRSQAEQASVLYQAVSDAVRAEDPAKAKDPATQIVQRYAGTAYAPRAALLYAKLLYDKDDRAGAKRELQWVIDHAGEDELKAIARFRLAEALLDEKNYDEALKTIDVRTDDAFAAIYADLRGDILAAAGKNAEARTAYAVALAKIDPKSPYRPYVQVKLDALGGAP
ncbi:MAG: YfgM family protein, partial [Casimicrobiaceae bacterium]